MKRFGHAVHAQMHFDPAVRKPARYLFADDDVRRIGNVFEQFECAIDRIVVGDGDQIHASCFRRAVHIDRTRVAIAAAQKWQRPVHRRVASVHVEIGTHRRYLSGFSTRT